MIEIEMDQFFQLDVLREREKLMAYFGTLPDTEYHPGSCYPVPHLET